MIPTVKDWQVTVVETGEKFQMSGPTKKLILIGFRMDYPRFWGKEIKIGLLRK